MIRRIGLAVLAATFVGAPVLATSAQAQTYRVTSIHQIAPNTLKYLLSHWSGAGNLESKLRTVEAKLSLKGGSIVEGPEGHEGKEGPAGAIGPAGSQGIPGIPGESIEGPEGKASDVAGPAGEQGIQGIQGEAGPEGAASEVPGPAGPQGERGPACEVSKEPACASTVPGPRGEVGPRGEQGESITGLTGPEGKIGPAGPRGEKGESVTGPAGPAGPTGGIGPAGPTGGIGPMGPAGETGPAGPEGKGGTPVAWLEHNLVEHMPRGHKTIVFARGQLPAGDYVVTGSLDFENRHAGSQVEQVECWVYLGGAVIDETFSIDGPSVSGTATSSAIVVASTGELTHEEEIQVQCEDMSSSGAEETYSKVGSLAEVGVQFK
jgi:hypothetical protein